MPKPYNEKSKQSMDATGSAKMSGKQECTELRIAH
jgi:hypothetical protein